MRPMASMVPFILWILFVSSFAAAQQRHRIDTRYKDPKQPLNTRIQVLLSQMTLEEKVAQMMQLNRVQSSAEIMRNYAIGSLISGSGISPNDNLRASPEDWVDLVNYYQNGSIHSRLGIPYIYGIDAVHGDSNVYRATIFPHNIGLGATGDPELVMRIGAATALETRAVGIPFAFAPCIAVCRDPRWGRCYESYSEEPEHVQTFSDIVYGLQGVPPTKGVPYVGKNKVIACAKHYVGDGGTVNGINENNTIIDWHGLLTTHMQGYYSSIIKGVSSVMVSYSSWNGVKMHTNTNLITDFLKGTMRFRGFVISDWQAVDKITNQTINNYTDPNFLGMYPAFRGTYSRSLAQAINAGIDMIMVPPNHTEFINMVTEHVRNRVIPMSRIDDSVRRILRVKFTMGLFENPMADYSLVDQIGIQRHRDIAREAVRKSMVLLKNGNDANSPMLPLPKATSRVLVAGTHANNLGWQCAGWTITWQGLNGNNHTQGTTIFNAISDTVDASTELVFSENPTVERVRTGNFSYAVVVVGEVPYAESAGDNMNLTIPEPGLSTMRNVCANVRCVVVLISGRPLVIEPYLADIDALVAAWLPGSEGQGVADVLFGDYGFTGKLSRTWFRNVNQLPMNVGDAHYDPLFPFGFGLTTQPNGS